MQQLEEPAVIHNIYTHAESHYAIPYEDLMLNVAVD